MKFEVTILGTNAAIPAYERYLSAQIVNVHDRIYMVDCGEGTQFQLNKYDIRRSRIHQIFISHLHGDHIYGLPGIITSYSLLGREKPLDIFAPKGLEEWINLTLKHSYAYLTFKVRFHTFDCDQSTLVFENESVEVWTIPLKHRIPTCGFLFKEKQQSRRIIPEQIVAHQIPVTAIKKIKQEGADFVTANGKVIPNDLLTLPAPVPRAYAYCSDTAYTESIIPIIQETDLLYHEATYLSLHEDQTLISLHSTAREAAKIAKLANVKQLLIGHFSSRYRDIDALREEAATIFPNTLLAKEGLVLEV
ncbi:MAG: ribonuclease Z [Saprospiraceae bacterium]|nr:ribonuclease Z [Saprospiraceae bacterium]